MKSGEVLEYLWQRFPQHCIVMTDPQTRRVIDLAAGRAAAHGFLETHEVCSWATLMMFFGAYFDEDPLCEWASTTLAETAVASREDAMGRLFSKMNDATAPIIGHAGEHYRRALLWTRSLRFEAVAADRDESVREGIERVLRAAYPTLREYLPPAKRSLLVREAGARAREFGLAERPGSILYALLISLLGFHIDRDPLHAWVREVLRDGTEMDPMAKTKKLHERGIALLGRYLVLGRFTLGR